MDAYRELVNETAPISEVNGSSWNPNSVCNNDHIGSKFLAWRVQDGQADDSVVHLQANEL